MANALTALRLTLVFPTALAFARPDFLPANVVALMLAAAIASDYLDGLVARATGTASPRGQLFDHATDCLFVTAGLTGAALSGVVTPFLSVLIPVAFGQYVVDSYVWHRQRRLRANRLGRWNGILYFVPLVVIAVSRLQIPGLSASVLLPATSVFGYALVASTVASMLDRATTPFKSDWRSSSD
jgi:phosphatidylglycerophosphate synthase